MGVTAVRMVSVHLEKGGGLGVSTPESSLISRSHLAGQVSLTVYIQHHLTMLSTVLPTSKESPESRTFGSFRGSSSPKLIKFNFWDHSIQKQYDLLLHASLWQNLPRLIPEYMTFSMRMYVRRYAGRCVCVWQSGLIRLYACMCFHTYIHNYVTIFLYWHTF